MNWNITIKLILVNTVIFLVVGGIFWVVNASFQSIQETITTTIDEDVERVIHNARVGRELNRAFSEINALIRSVSDEREDIDQQSLLLLENMRTLISQETLDERLQLALQNFLQELQHLFEQGTTIRRTLTQLRQIDGDMFDYLAELEELIAEKLIIFTMEGGEPASLQQLSTLIPGYRETLLRVSIQLSKLQTEHAGRDHQDLEDSSLPPEKQHPALFQLFDDLSLRFRTLLAAESDVAEYSHQLIETLEVYKQQTLVFHDILQQLDQQIQEINHLQESILSIMRESDDRVTTTTEEIQNEIAGVVGNSREIIVVLTAIVYLVLVLGWVLTHWMTRPLIELSQAASQLADGDINCHIQAIKSRDEIGKLARAFNLLIHYFQDMAKTATEISHGNLEIEIQPRSERDVFGNRFQQMIVYLRDIGTIASHVAQGDLRREVSLQSSRDQLGMAFTHMQEGLVTLIAGIRAGADYISSISSQILSTSAKNSEALGHIGNAAEVTSSAMQQMNSSAEEVRLSTEHLRSSVEDTSSSINEMTTSIKHVAENSRKLTSFAESTSKTVSQIVSSLETVAEQAENSKTLAEATTEDATSGQQSVEQMIVKIHAISNMTENLSGIILRLEKRSTEIGTILDVINEVADQTSLLALNASIIAAQAGTHGRGFAVVADEIKELANRVGTSTKEIAHIVAAVQRDSSEAADAIEEGQREVEVGVSVANEAGEALNKIGESAGNSSKVAAEIAVLVRQQTTASTHMAESTKDVAQMIAEITQATEEQERNSAQLLQIVQNMQLSADQVLRAMQEQQQNTHHVTDFMQDVTTLVEQNIPNVKQLAQTANELTAQAEELKTQVKRFVIPEKAKLMQ